MHTPQTTVKQQLQHVPAISGSSGFPMQFSSVVEFLSMYM